ncbi:MAG: YgiQ family radical SAM protein [Clostridiales bacterium]|nr:YgiQ family radical SAM protein [Clostridiales bacterium]
MREKGWPCLDFLLISGDAYVDHSSFGAAIIGRFLESKGFKVGVLPQPDWRKDGDFLRMGRPRLAVLVSSGNLDSMLANYTAAKKPRKKDDYSLGGRAGLRPDYAIEVYAKKARALFGPEMPLILGGMEASLRRFVHYDYWRDEVLPSVLVSSEADLLIYGMAEAALAEVAARLAAGFPPAACRDVAGLAYALRDEALLPAEALRLPSLDEVKRDKKAFARAFMLADKEQNFADGKILAQKNGEAWVVNNRPARPLTAGELDAVYELPYERRWHPSYDASGGIPAFDEVRFSLLSHRGCFGGCSFCSLNFHQGRLIQSRSAESLLAEARLITKDKDFKGYIHDVGGPSANFRGQVCGKAQKSGPCRDRQCLHPKICPRLPADSGEYEKLLTDLRRLPGVKKVFIRSGIRFDYLLAEKSRSFFHTLCRYHISGQLKVAPEHVVPHVLAAMGKPGPEIYRAFVGEYNSVNAKQKRRQFLVPYFISSHPGCTLKDAVALAEYLRDHGLRPEQAQDFIPTPGTLSTCMYYSGLDPRSMSPVYSAKTPQEKAMQRALLQYDKPVNRGLVIAALQEAGREDLIGPGPRCLIKTAEQPPGARRPASPTEGGKSKRPRKQIRQPVPSAVGRREAGRKSKPSRKKK